MLALWDQLTGLLGKPRAVNGDMLMQLIDELNEKPDIDCSDKVVWFYDFPKSGISLDFNAEAGIFTAFTLFITINTSEMGEGGRGRPYNGNLPYGIKASDSMATIESKFPGCTKAVKDYRFDLDLRPLIVTFHFRAREAGTEGESKEELMIVSVDYLRDKPI